MTEDQLISSLEHLSPDEKLISIIRYVQLIGFRGESGVRRVAELCGIAGLKP